MVVPIKDLNRIEHKKFDTYKIAYMPSLAIISLNQDDSTLMKSLVKKGQVISEGQIIAREVFKSKTNAKIKHPAYINSPVPGIVEDLSLFTSPNGKRTMSILIRLSGSFTFSGKKISVAKWQNNIPLQNIKKISENGVINTFEKCESLAEQLFRFCDKPKKPPVVVRLFDTEVDSRIDSFLADTFPNEILEGAAIIARTLGSNRVVFLAEKSNFSVSQFLSSDTSSADENIFHDISFDVVNPKNKTFPCGTYKKVNKICTSFIENKYNEKYSESFACDGQTCIDCYNAVAKSYPSISRFIQVDGDVLNECNIFKVKIGTPIKNLFMECGGFSEKPKKIIANGLIKGIAISDLDAPVTHYLKSVFAISSRGFPDQKTNNCIRCGRCHKVCPEFLHPEKLFLNYVYSTPLRQNIIDSAKLCTECGLCNTVCPARIPLFQTLQIIKENDNAKKL